MKKKFLAWVMTLAMLCSLVPSIGITALAAVAEVDTTAEADGIANVGHYTIVVPKGVEIPETDKNTTVISVPTDNTDWGKEATTTWYVVNTNVTIDGEVTLTGDVNLILMDDCTLEVIHWGDEDDLNDSLTLTGVGGDSLTIWQTTGSGSGELYAGVDYYEYCKETSPGLGINVNNLTINGGTVTAIGLGLYGYGIRSNTCTINGGTVMAGGCRNYSTCNENEREYFTGTGYGIYSSTCTINGGEVEALGYGDGAGLDIYGTGIRSKTCIITGGTVTATGNGNYNYYAGDYSYNCNGDGIGNGIYSENACTIKGGTVTATGTGNSNGKGYGIYGFGDCTIEGGTVTATGTDHGIYGLGACTITGGEVEATGTGNNDGNGYGIYSYDACTITGGTVTATGTDHGIVDVDNSIKIDKTLVVKTGDSSSLTGRIVENRKEGTVSANSLNHYVTVVPGYAMISACSPDSVQGGVTFTVDNTTDTYAEEGASVTATANPVAGYTAALSGVYGTNNTELTIGSDSTFTMPAEAVTVKANYTHTHAWTYEASKSVSTLADNDTITATCQNAGCDLTNDPTVTLSAPALKTYGGTENAEATLSDTTAWEAAGLTTPTIEYYNGTKKLDAAPTSAGKYTAKITMGEGDSAATASVNYEIAKAEGGGSVTMKDWTYGEIKNTPALKSTKNDTTDVRCQYKVKGADDSTYSNIVPTNAGTYTVKATFPATTNYEEATETAEFTIAQREITVAAGSYRVSKVYDGTTVAGTAVKDGALSVSGILDGDTISVTPGTIPAYDAKDVSSSYSLALPISITGDDSGNYTIKDNATTVSVPGKITAKTITVASGITATDRDYAPNDKIVALIVENAVLTGKVDGDTLSVTATGTMADDSAGKNKTVTISDFALGGTDIDNYALAASGHQKTTTVTINKAAPTVTRPTANTLTYTGAEQALVTAGTVTGGTMQYALGTDATTDPETGWSTDIPNGTNAGTYYVWYKVVGDGNHKNTDPDCVTVNIAPASLSFTATVADKTYDGTTEGTVKSVTFNGLKNNESLTLGTDYTATAVFDKANATGTDAATKATVTVTLSNTDKSKNYSLTNRTYDVTKGINKAPLTPTPAVTLEGWTAGGEANTPAVTGLPNDFPQGTEITYTYKEKTAEDTAYSETVPTSAGSYTVRAEIPETDNYEAATVPADFTISARSSGGGTKKYTVTAITADNGTVKSDKKNAAKGSTVTLTVTPDEGYALDTLTVTDSKGNEIELTKVDDTTYTYTMPSGKVTVTPTFVAAEETPEPTPEPDPTPTPSSGRFADVKDTDYFNAPVDWAAEKGITTGKDDTHFAPNDPCTRAQIVTFLWRAAGSPAPESETCPFTDVDKDAYYYDAVLWAVEKGITKGMTDTMFGVDKTCTRGQAVTFLHRYEGSKTASAENPFEDVQSEDFFCDAVLWATENEITNGTGANAFSPLKDCTRGEIVTFLYRDMVK